jgi:enterochelin esterase-like enzyme
MQNGALRASLFYSRVSGVYSLEMPIAIRNNHVTFTAPENAQHLIGDFTDGLDRPTPLKAGESVTLEFPKAAFVEYGFLDAEGTPFADPDNEVWAENPWYKYGRAAILGGYKPQPLREPLPEAAKGRTVSLSWVGKVFAGTRRAYVHLPPNFDETRVYPVFYVQDGVAYRRTGKLGSVMENLLHFERIKPAILVFLEPNDRTLEYHLNPQYLEFLLTEAMPEIEAKFPVSVDAATRGLWGASLGGMASVYAALRRPDLFGMVVSQSGAFQGVPDQPYKRGAKEWLLSEFQNLEKLNVRFSLECGQIEWLLGTNRRFAAMLFDKGYAHRYLERPSGHNWVTWRDGLVDSLEFMLG